MIAVPRWVTAGPTWVLAAYTVGFALSAMTTRAPSTTDVVALALFVLAFAATVRRPVRAPVEAGVLLVCIALPLLVTAGLDRAGSYSSGGWHVSAVACLAVRLLLHARARSAYAALVALTVHTALWAGVQGLVGFGVLAVDLLVGVGAVCAWAVGRTELEMARFSAAEQEAASSRAAQDAYQQEREVRLLRVAAVAADMLRRIVATRGALTDADRTECRVLEQTIRDENRGRALLNDAVRREVMAARRRGATVQLMDDGGLDDLPDEVAERLRDRLAAAIAPLTSSRIVIRAVGKAVNADEHADEQAITLVATSSDPVAAALGVDDDETVDLWLSLDRAGVAG